MSPAKSSSGRSSSAKTSSRRSSNARKQGPGLTDGLGGVVEQLVNRVLRPLDIVMLSRERIQQTLDEAAERGRMTRGDANELVGELLRRGRQQTDELLGDMERIVGRVAGRGRPSKTAGNSFPISGYDELTASQTTKRLSALSRPELRRVREYESRHANRKSVLEAIDRALR
jgi:hypothetical protein